MLQNVASNIINLLHVIFNWEYWSVRGHASSSTMSVTLRAESSRNFKMVWKLRGFKIEDLNFNVKAYFAVCKFFVWRLHVIIINVFSNVYPIKWLYSATIIIITFMDNILWDRYGYLCVQFGWSIHVKNLPNNARYWFEKWFDKHFNIGFPTLFVALSAGVKIDVYGTDQW